MNHRERSRRVRTGFPILAIFVLSSVSVLGQDATPGEAIHPSAANDAVQEASPTSLKSLLDAPLLFVKRHPYFAGHIYDDYITWHPGGGIYVLENPGDPPQKHRVRPVIDPTTNETLGEGVYRDPELSWDAERIVFAFKGEQEGNTCIYEIGVDGSGLRRLTNPDVDCPCAPQEIRTGKGHHDITPSYLADGRIVFTSTRPRALVPCFNSGVDTLHVMDADGKNIRSLSVNNVNEFDPAVMHDGRILYGRWEYVDKTALYMQSLWTISPDGRMEEALFGNNLAKPTAVLDARPVPDSHLIAAALTPHNGQAVGAIVTIDPRKGKNSLQAITNFTPEYATEMDQGLKVGPSDPWPLSEDAMLIANNAQGHAELQIVHCDGRREPVFADPDISCYAPMLVRPRPKPSASPQAPETDQPGSFLVTDIYRGLTGVERGSVKRLRIVEETARTSGIPPGGRWWNQAFLVSWQGAYVVKNVLGTVPVHEDGSAYFQAPAGRAVYFEALDEDNREVQRMRTFVQSVPGVTRSCVGCHEHKYTTTRPAALPLAMRGEPAKPQPESWGSGLVDYATMVQPILDRHCVSCHGGPEGIAKGIDLTGGWTWAFNISYETLLKNRLTGFLNCHNSSVHTSELLPPRSTGSGASPLADLLLSGHDGHIKDMRPAEIELLFAWMDTNSNYYGSWDYTPHATAGALLNIRGPLASSMQQAGCTTCHTPGHIGNDWVNLQTPEWSRILRAPLADSPDGLGLAMCRDRKARVGYPLVDQRVQPPDMAVPSRQPAWDDTGAARTTFASSEDQHYHDMLETIRRTRAEVLSTPRVDMPGAVTVGGECRMQVMPELPLHSPPLTAEVTIDGLVRLSWPRTADAVGFQYEVHRGDADRFECNETTHIGLTTAGVFVDSEAPVGDGFYSIRLTTETSRSQSSYARVSVPTPTPPTPPGTVNATGGPGEVSVTWSADTPLPVRYEVLRAEVGVPQLRLLTDEPLGTVSFIDCDVQRDVEYEYRVRSVDRRGQVSPLSEAATAAPRPLVREPVFVAPLASDAGAQLLDGRVAKGKLVGPVQFTDGAADLTRGGHVQFAHLPEFDLRHALTVQCWLRIDQPTQMPVVLACGAYQRSGWFLQRYGRGWRWHMGSVSCDGGSPVVGQWVHLTCVFDGRRAMLYQDGRLVADVPCQPNRQVWTGPLCIGQYSSAGQQYQVNGAVADIKIYQRAITTEEAAAAHREGPPGN